MAESFGEDTCNPFRGVVLVVQGYYRIAPLIRSLPWLYHLFYISRLYRDDFYKLGSIQSEEYTDAVSVVKKELRLYIEMYL